MRYNKLELIALASQTSQTFDREGVLVLKEEQDGFFRRSEGSTVRWFRLRGNLLFYLKGPESWYEPMGVIVLGNHEVKVQSQDENGHWPFHIVWGNGVCYRMATYHETERTLWLKAIQLAPYDHVYSQIAELKERLNRIRPIIDIESYRVQKGIVTDMNEVPLCELALSCDNLLCDTHGRPPSPMVVVYVRNLKSQCVRYGTTETIETCSNPCFSKTILFRASDGLTGDALVRLVVYDVKEQVSETTVPIGFTSLKLITIQEAQRLRVSLLTCDNKTVGFVTINGWSLEPSYIGTSPIHTNDKNCIDIPQKVMCHRRSQSLPPRLGLKLKFPSYGTLIKQNFTNSHQVTYRFHSGLGGDITVHEIMAEPKMCFLMPAQLLDIYIQREKELLEELLSVSQICGQWQSRKLKLVSTHVSILKHYCHSKKCMLAMDSSYFKPSARKDEASLEFAPVNLHLQRMWVHNDTLNKTGFHDVITAGAFAAHTHKAERTGGLIRLVQHVKDINSGKAELGLMRGKLHSEYDNIAAAVRLREELSACLQRASVLAQAAQRAHMNTLLEEIKSKVKCILALWEPSVVEESLSYIGWPKNNCNDEMEQTMATIMRMTEQLSVFDASSDGETFDGSSGSSSKETSPTGDQPLSFSVPNINCKAKRSEDTELQFHNDYFNTDREDRTWNHSFRSVRSARMNDGLPSLEKRNSLGQDYKSTASLEQVTYRSLVDSLAKNDRRKTGETSRESLTLTNFGQLDQEARDTNLAYLSSIRTSIEDAQSAVLGAIDNAMKDKQGYAENELDGLKALMDELMARADEATRWMRVSHAALRLRCESPQWARENAALQIRRDTCFSQALTTLTTGLICWLSSVPTEVAVKVLTSGLGPLCVFEGLLSLYLAEKAMWGDMVVAVEDLHNVIFTLTKVGHSNSAVPQVKGTRGSLVVHLPVSDTLYGRFASKEHLSFTITAVFFNIGINEKATLAEALGETTPQIHSNSDNLDRLNKYYYKYSKIFPPDHVAPMRASSRTKSLEEVMENLSIAVQKKIPKNVEVLHLASVATRLMNGVRFTSCKSAKDRTGMSVTLEQCSILASEYHLAEHEMKKALNIMRSEGCRRENTLKNIRVLKYAFTKKQVMALPEDYRPPPGTYGSSRT